MLPMNARLRNPRRSLASNPISVPVSSYSPWTPLALQPKLWLDASDLTTITESGGAVSEWRDKSGNGYAFTQATSTAQPTTGSTTQNGLNVLSFDGGDLLLSTASASTWKFMNDGTSYIIGVVFKRTTTGVGHTFFATFANLSGIVQPGCAFRILSTNVYNAVIFNNSQPALSQNAAVINASSSATISTTNFHVVTTTMLPTAPNTARARIAIDGGTYSQTQGSNNTAYDGDPYTTLAVGSLGNVANLLTGYLAEIVVVAGAQVNEGTRNTLHRYLNTKWAVY